MRRVHGDRHLAVPTPLSKRREDRIKTGFDAIAGPATRLLLLGSLPGDRSLALGQYYGHPTNQFWRLMEGVLGEPLAALPYDRRLARFDRRGVGLWDVLHAAHRDGSSDSRIRAATANDLAALVARFPALQAIAFNGGTAAAEGRRAFRGDLPFALVDLPSSSAANTMRFEAKLAAWMALAPFVG